MALTEAEKYEIVNMLDRMERRRIEATLRSEHSFLSWLKRAAYWLFDKIAGTIVGRLISWLWGLFFA